MLVLPWKLVGSVFESDHVISEVSFVFFVFEFLILFQFAFSSPEEEKMEDYSVAENNSAAESVRIENEQPEKIEKASPGSAMISGCHEDENAASGKEAGSSEFPKEDNEKDNKNSGDTVNGRSELLSGSKSKMDVDKLGSVSTRE